MIYYLIYLSASTHLYTQQELLDILKVSRENNSSTNITGLLLYHQGNILQILEGEKETVQNLYKKISLDNRHRNVIKLVAGEYSTRSFAEWSMAFKSLTPEEWSIYQGYIQLQPDNLHSIMINKNSRIDTSWNSFTRINKIT